MGGGPLLDGLWTAIFNVRGNSAGGIIVFSEGRARGGDSTYFYVGTYSLSNGELTANLTAYAYVPNAVTVFGVPAREFEVKLTGRLRGGEISANGTVMGMLPITVMLTRRC